MVYIEIIDQSVFVDGARRPDFEASVLRQRYRIDPTEAVALLIGKDGGAKLR